MLARPLVMMGAVKQALNPGDILDASENPLLSVTVAGAVSLTGQQCVNGDVVITGGTAHTVSFPTADQLVKALIGSINKMSPPDNQLYGSLPSQSVQLQWPANGNPLQAGASFRRIFRNENSGTTTFAAQASSGVTGLGTLTIATALWIEFLVRILNSSPLVVLVVSTSNAGGAANKKLTNVNKDLIANVTVGMSVYGTGIGASAKVTAVDLDAGIIYVDVDSTATADNIAVTFTPTVTFQRVRSGTN